MNREKLCLPKVSIIMPSLNVAAYIDDCVRSVINQTLKEIEIIIVDAGSTDGTLEIIKHYAENDNRIILLHSDRKSYGYQMNLGVHMAKGKYIGIVETDDLIKPDMMETLYDVAVREDADYVKGVARGFFSTEKGVEWDFTILPCRELEKEDKVILNPSEHPILFITDNFLWNGIYKSSFLKNIKFHETPGAAFQDISELFRIISTAQKAVYVNHLVYDYRQNNVNASSYNKKSFQYAATEYEYIQQFLSGLSEDWIKQYYLKMVGLSFDRMILMANSGSFWEEADDGIKQLQNMLTEGLNNGYVKWEDFENRQGNFAKCFLRNPREIFEELEQEYREKKEKLTALLKTLYGKKYYIFCVGLYGQFIHMYLQLQGMETMQGFCDNSRQLHGKCIMGQKIYHLEDIEDRKNMYFVIASNRYKEEIQKQLLEEQIPQEQILLYNLGVDRLLFLNVEKWNEKYTQRDNEK